MHRGNLPKRMKRRQTFRSVLSMDVEYQGNMPNLKISSFCDSFFSLTPFIFLTITEHRRNTLQMTIHSKPTVNRPRLLPIIRVYRGCGCQDLQALGDILSYLVNTYEGRGFTRTANPDPGLGTAAGFVGDLVLENVYFRLGFKLDRGKLRDAVNDQSDGMLLASYEPLVRDVSVNVD